MKFAPSRRLLPIVSPRSATPRAPRAAVAVSAASPAIEVAGACMLIAVFLAMAMFG